MIQTILAFFGYIKVPKEAIQLSMCLEDDFKNIIKIFLGLGEIYPDFKGLEKHLEVRKNAVKVMTQFLRSGKLLN